MTEPRHRLGKRPPIWALPRDRTLSNLRFLTLAALPPSLLRQRVNSLIMTRWLRGPLCRRVVFALAALFQLSCRFIEKRLSYRTNANAGADSRIWRAAAKLISDGQHPSSMGFQRLCVAANLRTHRNLTVVTDNVAMLSVGNRPISLTTSSRFPDVGCGPYGPLVFAVKSTGCKGTGLDVSAPAISSGRARASAAGVQDRVALLEADLNLQIAFDGSLFDAAISLDLVVHLSNRKALFHEMARS